jgi:ABC-type sulfate/molybdate transport systems ATPase subunit
MKAFENTKVKNLSGGQKQRVAIARALANEPELLLLDEPFGQIDNFKKNSLRRKLFAYLKEKNIACIVATHDKNDALSFADSLLIIRNNKILVNNTPIEIYKKPKNKYIAALFDDVNEIVLNEEKVLLYPHQIKMVENLTTNTALPVTTATVLNSYFKGAYWLIEAVFENQIVFFNHNADLEKNKAIHLSFTLK